MKRINKLFRRKQKNDNVQILLSEINSIQINGESYCDDTLKVITNFNNQVQKELNKILDEELERVEIIECLNKLKYEKTALYESIEEGKLSLFALEEKCLKALKFGVEFVENTNFYPPEYAFDINKLQGYITEIEDHKKKNPLINLEEVALLVEKIYSQINDYKLLHSETISLISKIKIKLERSGKKENQSILETKEKLFRELQMGNLSVVRAELKKIKKEIKRI